MALGMMDLMDGGVTSSAGAEGYTPDQVDVVPNDDLSSQMVSMAKGYLFDSITAPTLSDAVIGQYKSYQAHVEQDRSKWMKELSDIEAISNTPTFAAVRLSVNSERWKGVPVYVTSGKAMEEREACVSVSVFLIILFLHPLWPHLLLLFFALFLYQQLCPVRV